jgi:hypothetical protein
VSITFVGAGAIVTGNNAATLTPARHASTTDGDLVLVYASIRGTSASMTVAGYTLLADGTNARLFGRIAQAGDGSPTVTFTGGAAGDDNIAQCASFRGIETSVAGIVGAAQTNGSAQNVAYPAVTVAAINHAVVVAGWKQDDSTGWAAIASYTEIGESNPTTGNDASSAWDYQIQTTATNLTAGSFTVTGGLTAVSKALTLLIRPAAAITVDAQDSYPPRTLVSVTGLTLGDDVSVYRQVAGERTLLRAGTGTDVADPAFLVVDAELPFGVAVSYVAVVNSFAEYATGATTYDLPGGKVALSDAVGGDAAEVVILSWPEKERDTNSAVYRAGARNIVVSAPLGQFTSTIDFFLETTSAVENLDALLASATQNTVQIRQPGGYDGVDSYVAALSSKERRWSQDGSDPRRIVSVDVVEVSGWADALEARGYTLQDIADYYGTTGTLQDIADDFVTLLDIAQAEFIL